ncbi:MAG: methionine--tRNA ligase [Bergeyella sp.]|nr:methionine--tRNA ligase [Bergeyella sp.]
MSKRTLITSALPYANGPIHIGHLAGVYIPSDVYARFSRKVGKDVVFICGSDEHGIPITMRAKKENTNPQNIVDKYHSLIKDTFDKLGISFDHYSRTTSKKHYAVSQDFFSTLYKKKSFIEEISEQYFDEKAGEFLADRYIVGTCPNCGNPNAYGDQCESCGTTLSPSELMEPRSMLSGNTPVLKSTKNWYLPLNEYEDFLQDWIIKGHEKNWKSNVYGQVKSWLTEGLKPRAMTRDLDWGIPVPLEKAKGKVLYVWFDAPIGYISFTQEWAEKTGKNWKDYWKDPSTELVHFIGKDNIVFHCIIFPVMLKAHGDYILPGNVPAFEFLNLENEKISTSRNWAVWAHEYLEDFPGKQDVLRYVLLSSSPETKDNNFTWKDFQTKNNSELVGIYGNFINRVTVLLHKYYGGKVPKGTAEASEFLEISKTTRGIRKSLEKYEFRNALSTLMDLARFGNLYLQNRKPWKTFSRDKEKTEQTLFIAAQIAAGLAHLSEPFMPFSSEKLLNMFRLAPIDWEKLESGSPLILTGHLIREPSLLFSKIEDNEIEKQIQKLLLTKTKNDLQNCGVKPMKELIDFEDFSKIDLRTVTILSAEKVENTDKLLKMQINTGVGVRTVVSGIAEGFSPESLVGKQVVALLNLTPRKIRGIESQGMLLLTTKSDGKFSFVVPEDRNVENGTEIG